MIEKTLTKLAPWHLVPANNKPFGRLAAFRIIADRLSKDVDLEPRALDPKVAEAAERLIGVATSWGCTNMARRWFVHRVTTPPPIAVLGSVTWARGCRFCCGASAMGCA
jgi:hypothetical protein